MIREQPPLWIGMRYATDRPTDRPAQWHGASPERSTMTTSQKLWLGFGTLTALLVLSSVAIIVRVRSIEGHYATETS